MDHETPGRRGRIARINVSDGGVPKLPVVAAELRFFGLSGDRQANLDVHGGPDRAVCLFSLEVIERLAKEGHAIGPGSVGENLTLSGLDWALVVPGTRLRFASQVAIEITDYCPPCRTIASVFVNRQFKRISPKKHKDESRVYARVLSEGAIATGDEVWIE
jgi:MOSC domain-containing protein YiiM